MSHNSTIMINHVQNRTVFAFSFCLLFKDTDGETNCLFSAIHPPFFPCLCLVLWIICTDTHIGRSLIQQWHAVTPFFLPVITLYWWVSSGRMDFLQDAGLCCRISMQKDIWVSYSGCAGIRRLARSQFCGCRAAQTLSNLCSVALSSEGL